jgi:hypothetical protein
LASTINVWMEMLVARHKEGTAALAESARL